MSKKKDNQQEPWSRRFGEDENYENRQYSRSARKSTKKEVAPLSKVLLFLFLALLIIPFGTYYWHEKTKTNPNPQTPDQVMINKQESQSDEESEAALESSVADEQESRREESYADVGTTSESTPPESIIEDEEPESVAIEEETAEEPEDTESEESVSEAESEEVNPEYMNTYTVQAGDNLFRIALNHGMDLEELKSVNGLTSDVAEIGQVLIVR